MGDRAVTSVGGLVALTLGAVGIAAVYGEPLPGFSVVTSPPRVAALLARAHERVHGERAAVHSGAGTLRVGGTGPWTPVPISAPADLAEHRETLVSEPVELRLDLDLEAPVDRRVANELAAGGPPVLDRWSEPAAGQLDALAKTDAPVVLAGPGVVTQGAVAGLHALAVAGSFGVLNTWGAKGVFHWQSRHHWATVGLQARDFELGGLGDTDLIVATGIDALEAPPERWQLGPVLTVEPQALDPLAEALRRPWRELQMPPLRARLAAVTQAGWAESGSPVAPSRVTLNYGQALGGGGVVAADPGTAGFWVARTFGTTELGSVQVPAERDAQGFAPACVTVARLRRPGRPALAVVDGPVPEIPEIVHEVIEAARRLGVAVPVEVWSPGGDRLDADDHLARVRRMAYGAEGSVAALAVDDRQLTAMIDAAGPIIAWQPPDAGSSRAAFGRR
jgi:hypothetical protein